MAVLGMELLGVPILALVFACKYIPSDAAIRLQAHQAYSLEGLILCMTTTTQYNGMLDQTEQCRSLLGRLLCIVHRFHNPFKVMPAGVGEKKRYKTLVPYFQRLYYFAKPLTQ